MTEKLMTAFKILVVILFLVAIGMGIWFVYMKLFRKEDGGEETAQQIELVWWVLWEDEADMQVLADLYEQEHPNVTITIQTQIADQYRQKLLTQISDNLEDTGPDLMRVHNTWLPLFQSYLTALPSSVMSSSAYSETFYDTALQDFQGTDGMIYGIPLEFDAIGVYYNKDLLRRAGYTIPEDTWDDFRTQAQALTEYYSDGSIKIAGAGIGSAENVDSAFEIASLLMLQEGATIVDSTGRSTFGTDSEMKVAKAIKFYTDFATKYHVWDRSLPRDITMFAEGRLAMMFAPSWRVFDIEVALASAGATLNYDIAPVPQQPTETGERVNWADYWAEAVSSECEHPDVAWDFLYFISQPDALNAFYEKCKESRAFGEIYPRKDMAEEIITDQYVGAYVKMAETATSWRMVDQEKSSEEFESLIEEIASRGELSVSAIQADLEETATAIDQILQSGG